MEESFDRKKHLAFVEKLMKYFASCPKLCAFSSCKENAISSHVYQNSTILSNISDSKGELMEFRFDSIFNAAVPQYKAIHRNNVLTYPGFCQYHDNRLFSPIEPQKKYVDWSSPLSQQLLAYRTICRELYVANLGANVFNQIIDAYSIPNPDVEDEYLVPFEFVMQRQKFGCIIDNLIHYRNDFENAIDGQKSSYHFHYIEIPFRLELCVAATIAGTDKRGPCFITNYQDMNVINIFPYGDKTIAILGYDEQFENIWEKNILDVFAQAKESYNPLDKAYYYNTALMDILFRTDFHCLSKKLYSTLNKDQITAFLDNWNELRDEYTFDIASRSCLFYDTIKESL